MCVGHNYVPVGTPTYRYKPKCTNMYKHGSSKRVLVSNEYIWVHEMSTDEYHSIQWCSLNTRVPRVRANVCRCDCICVCIVYATWNKVTSYINCICLFISQGIQQSFFKQLLFILEPFEMANTKTRHSGFQAVSDEY